jgi:type I restriction enzyme S subunit
MIKYKRYERYKDSGVEWIGEIPEHWEIKKIKYISNITMGQSPKSEECSLDETGLPFLQGNAEFTSLHPIPKIYCNTANKFSKVNDILLSVRAPVGAMNISDRVYGIGRGLCAITANKVQVRYLWYSMNVSLEELFIKSKGSTFEAVTVTDVNNLLSVLPPKNEQTAIANFLDQKTAEIDGLIADKEKLIELLQEKRQAIITEAVTKGLNPNVRMKDSGIEWIGEIPEHWGVSKIKFTTYVKGRIGWQGLRADEFIDEGPYLVTGTDFVDGLVNWDSCYHISMERYNEAPPIQLRENDLLITKDGTIGKVAIVKNKPKYAILNSGIFVTRPKNSAYLTEFMYWILNSQVFNKFIQYMSLGSTIVHLYQQTFENFSFPITNLNEQKTIAHFLDRKVAEIDGLISDIKLQIQKLKEYRQSLISEAVTGKIDVREFQKKNEVIFRNE